MSAPSLTYISMRATASSIPWVGRQSVRASTRIPDSLAASTAARIFMRASSRRQARLARRRERARRDLVLDQDGGGAGAAIGPHGALNVHRIAIAMVAVGQHQRLRRRGMDHVEGIEHLAEGDQVEVGTAQAARRDAGPGQEGRLEAGGRRQLGAEPVPHGRHHDEAGLGKQRTQTLGRVHDDILGTGLRLRRHRSGSASSRPAHY